MAFNFKKASYAMLASCATMALVQPALAQDAPENVAEDDDNLIVVTAVAKGQNLLDSSVSISALDADTITDLNPTSAADLFRQLPGIRSEASGGEGNANINVRGLPVSTGGGRYVQLQEDSLPVLEFGDIVFGNADNYLRADRNIGRVEVVRGGSASTFASNAPGAVINFISKTGQQEGGGVAASVGLDFESYRLDFDYGSALSDDLYFHVGGFYRTGEGARDTGFNGFNGGQLKANITKEFDGGYIRFYGKYLDDRTATFLPAPVQVTGSADNPNFTSLPNFEINRAALQSSFFTTATSLDAGNNPAVFDITDGLEVVTHSLGFETEFEIADGWTVTERFRFSDNSGGFTSPFPASAGAAQGIAEGIGGAGATLQFASGPNSGAAADPTTIGGNGILTQVVLFNVRVNSLDNVTNDIRLNKRFDFDSGSADFTAGFYASRQEVETEWLWTSHLQTTEGGGNAALVDVLDSDGNLVTQNGTIGFGASLFGNCCRRIYDVAYDTYAPFASLSLNFDRLTVDGSIRYDFGNANGTIFGADAGIAPTGVTSFDFNLDGNIDPAEAQTSFIPLTTPSPVNYSFDYFSFSLGANYLLTDNFSAFARYSQGGRNLADRVLFTPAVSAIDGSAPSEQGVIATVDQLEAGVKYVDGGLRLFATAFYAEVAENNIEIAPLNVIVRDFESFGVEFEGSYQTGPFTFSAGGTWTDAEIADDANPMLIGNTPRRQADFIYQGSAKYDDDFVTFGVNIIGTSESFAQDNNDLVLPGFTQVNLLAAIRPMDRFELALNVNNLFDINGFTEAEEGSIPANNIVRARSIQGRTVLATARFDF